MNRELPVIGSARETTDVADSPQTSVLLPTTRWTDACGEVADQLREGDELLVIHDDGDPVAGRTDTLEGVRLVAAGEPDRCSGKANAIAAGIEAACHDRLILTDDDFHHPPDWLATLTADYDRYGPVSEVPYFVGLDPLAVLFEPMLASTASLGIYLGNRIWGGAVVFERDDINERAYIEELRRTVSASHGVPPGNDSPTDALRPRRRYGQGVGRTPGSLDEDHSAGLSRCDRRSRFRIGGHARRGGAVPVPCGSGPDGVSSRRQRGVGRPQVDSPADFPAVFLYVPLVPYRLARRTFIWGNRRYRWRSKFDVEIVK